MIIPDIADCMITWDDVPTIDDAASMGVKVYGALSGGGYQRTRQIYNGETCRDESYKINE